jgi:hypothetical protein
MMLNLSQPAVKLVATGIAVSVTAFANPAKAVEYGYHTNLSALDMSYEACMDRAYQSVRDVATDGFTTSGQGFKGKVGSNTLIQVACVRINDKSTAAITVVFIEPAQADSVFDRLKSLVRR